MTERVYHFNGVLDLDDFLWLEKNRIHATSFNEPARTIDYQGKSYHYTGRHHTRLTTTNEKTDLMLQLKFSDKLLLIETREYESKSFN